MSKELANPSVPSYLKDRAAIQLEGIENEDFATPRLMLLQALSSQVEDDLGKAGNFFHSGSETDLGSEIVVTPCFITKAYTLWRPRPDGGILARSKDAKTWDKTGSWEVKLKGVAKPVRWQIKTKSVKDSGLGAWGSSNPDDPDSPPAATLSYNIPVIIRGHYDLGPAVLSMQRSQIRVARKLLGRLRMQTSPYYALTIPLCSVKEQGAEGPFFNIKFGKFGYVDETEFKITESLYNSFQELGVNVKDDDLEPDEGPINSAAGRDNGGLDEEIPF